MFESATDFDLDDDGMLDTSFKPPNSSTQVSPVPKRQNIEVKKENIKKRKCVEDTTVKITETSTECVPIRLDTFNSPNRVVRRKFPGPAGLLPEIGTSNKSILQLLENEKLKKDHIEDVPILSQQTNSVFENGPWKEMCKDFYGHNEDNRVDMFNIKWIKSQALKQLLNHKAPFLAAIVQNLDIVDGKVPTINITLKDSTGEIRGTILHSLYEEYSNYFRIGSVLVLKHFGVLSAGYNKHCVTITPNNLISIYCSEAVRKLPNENDAHKYVQDCVKKVTIQDCNIGEIFKKYNEDVLAYSEEKKSKIHFGNLYRNRSSEASTSFSLHENNSPLSSKSMLSNITDKCQQSNKNTSALVFGANYERNRPNNTTLEESGIASVSYGVRHETPMKKFNYKKTFNTNKSIRMNENESAMAPDDRNVDKSAGNCDTVVTSNQISVKPESREHTEIWKTLLEGVDADSLFDDF